MWSRMTAWLTGRSKNHDPFEGEADLPTGVFVLVADRGPGREVVLPTGDRSILATRMSAEHAIQAFMSKCGVDGYDLANQDGSIQASASFEGGGIDILGLPGGEVTPPDLRDCIFFQVYAAGDARREDDAYFARDIGCFAGVTSRFEDLVIAGRGALWRAPDSIEAVSIELRPNLR